MRILIALGVSAGLALAAERVEIDPERSRVQVDIEATAHFFTAELTDYEIDLRGEPSGLRPTRFRMDWEFADLKTGHGDRDEKMLEWLGGKGPQGSFELKRNLVDPEGGRVAEGELEIAGVTKTILVPYTVARDGRWVTISGETTLDYRDFKLPVIRSALVMRVDPKLRLRIHLVGKY